MYKIRAFSFQVEVKVVAEGSHFIIGVLDHTYSLINAINASMT